MTASRYIPMVGLALLFAGTGLPTAATLPPQSMVSNPPEKMIAVGRIGHMPKFPSQPVPGYPGATEGGDRAPASHPQLQPYPGAVEHYRVWDQHYIHPVPPFNYRTLLTNTPAIHMAGVTPDMRETWAEPVEFVQRTGPSVYTGDTRPPVPVVRLKPGGARLRFNLPPLPTGMYVVRLIAAIPSDRVEGWEQSPPDLVVGMTINDGPAGETRDYVMRQRATDNFYSLGEFYFHAEDARPWAVSLGLHADSSVDLLVHNVDVHDVLAETAKRGGKRRSVLIPADTLRANWAQPESVARRQAHEAALDPAAADSPLAHLRRDHPEMSDSELRALWRRQRDDAIWLSMPPKNVNWYKVGRGGPNLASRPDPETEARSTPQQRALYAIDAGWFPPYRPGEAGAFWRLDEGAPWRMVWPRGEGDLVAYTAEDLLAHRSLPGLPVDAPPWGRSFDGPDGQRYLLFPVAQAVATSLRHALDQSVKVGGWVQSGIADAAHDTAMYLIRLVYDLPSYQPTHAINDAFAPRGAYHGRLSPLHFRRGAVDFVSWTPLLEAYDALFAYIHDNQTLADSVGRHVGWVKTPADVIALLDTYLIQMAARDMLYHGANPGGLAAVIAMQTDPGIADAWVKALFDWTWVYPYPYAGIQDYMYLATQRDGTQIVGSYFYALEAPALSTAVPFLDEYIADGGDARYRLSDSRQFPRVAHFPHWLLENRVAGLHGLQIGDVGGPTTRHGEWWGGDSHHMNLGWAWTRDPRFAWMVKHFGTRGRERDEEWAALEAAAATVARNPVLNNRSRVLADWGAILEAQPEADDFRLRHAARIRIGTGMGHAHKDTLDLGLWSQGVTMVGDMAGRGGYGRPSTFDTHAHNLVSIDRRDWTGHAWARALADLDTLQYADVRTLPFEGEGHRARQMAVIEVDRGRPSAQPPSDPRLGPDTVFGPDIAWPRAYLVDVVRTAGGTAHSYNVHGPTEDHFEVNVARGAPTDADALWLAGYLVEGEQWAANNDQPTLTADWRMARESVRFTIPERGTRTTRAPEPAILGPHYDPDAPRKHLRVHIPGQQGTRVRSGVAVSAPSDANRKDGDWLRRLHVVRTGAPERTSSLFAAVFEPYAGEPFVDQVRLEGDPADAAGYAAVRVTLKGGRHDLVFSDATRPQPRVLEDGVRVEGEFAMVSRDAQGLRQASLVGGRRLELPEFALETEASHHEAAVTSLDYLNNTAVLDRPLPDTLAGRFFEVGVDARDGRGARWTNFEVTRVDGPRLQWRKGADGGSAVIDRIEPVAAITSAGYAAMWRRQGATDRHVILHTRMLTGLPQGRDKQVTLMKEGFVTQVSADVNDGTMVLLLAEDAAALKLTPGDRVRFYEISTGDTFRAATQIALQRDADGHFIVHADAPCTLTVTAPQAAFSRDAGATWTPFSAGDGRLTITRDMLAATPVRLRLKTP